MNVQLPLRVFKTRQVGWRCSVSASHVGFLDAWNIEDAAGRFLAGGLADPGSNVKSACAHFRRKREAEAYAAGYAAWLNGDLPSPRWSGGRLSLETMDALSSQWPWPRHDERVESAYQGGAIEAQMHQARPGSLPAVPWDLEEGRSRAQAQVRPAAIPRP